MERNTKTMYKVVPDGTYSYIDTIEVEPELVTELDGERYYEGIEVFDTFTEAKRDMIEYFQLMRDIWADALRDARKLKKTDID